MRLYHYTCDHAKRLIEEADLVLQPQPLTFFAARLLWLTDLERPDTFGLGLTSFMLRCDRTAWRFSVDSPAPEPWVRWAHRNRIPLHVRVLLDGATGAQPVHWWVSEEPIEAYAVSPTKVVTHTDHR